jgi:ketosteroid isomerase-like protein
MNDRQQTQPVDPAELPEAITRYLDARQVQDTPRALSAFAADAVVIDEGKTYTGSKATEKWMTEVATKYTYTVQLIAAERTDSSCYVVTNHLEGDFPGGEVDLRFQFTLEGGLIKNLTIEP